MNEEEKLQMMGSLMSRMTAASAEEARFTDEQIASLINIFIPRFVMEAPGMKPAGLTCRIDQDERGWTIRIDKP
ncbi:hypothetical protein LITTLEE_193 [Mycobacterium phage LittleE]|uniref:Uncharacterized protein n=3 Tax=Omegavirus TaxID=1623292 RepID=G1D477_9CAUD|nr:hypothetical protein CM09_gp236 [Mycobacterium phage Courthouse]YP_009205320.1 hypothetical protein AVT17_gp240 [Mycobacterium phage Ariel]YP_009213409.1 hypothetical protein AVV70_gp245 [Mycobacterium phage MiaZeal]YP_009637103.1 hypothetical protein FGG27_gp227 [Mycobacterium phage LittleE]ASZ74261.1 hypothetical protein SEA_SQUINT_186 [Mycobacterium phage Squint]ATS93027.1 hypothetical protein SEA_SUPERPHIKIMAN_189 [Mycobacterium phage Superphikiman]QGJ93821.1 hypothetical protein SEA_H